MIRMMDGDFGDAHRAEQLEKRAAGIRRQIAEAQDMISPQPLRDQDPLEAATRRANAAFREVTRQRMAEAQQSRPQARPPFASRAAAGAVAADVTCADCVKAGATAEQSAEIHAGMDRGAVASRAGSGYSEWLPCQRCGVPADRCTCSPQVYA
jgi:hypothetical protein